MLAVDVSISPDESTSHWMGQAILHHQQGDLPRAEAFYRRVLEREPDHADALHFLGLLAAQAGHPQPALKLIDRSIALAPESAHFYVNRGNVLHGLGRVDEAIAAYRHAIAGAPDDVSAHVNLAQALRGVGRLDEALESAGAAMRLGADDAEMHNLVGAMLGDLGRIDEAIEAFEQALARCPEQPGARENLERARQERAERTAPSAPAAAIDERPRAVEPDAVLLQFDPVESSLDSRHPGAEPPAPMRASAADDSRELLRMLQEGRDPADVFDAHRAWNATHAAALTRDAAPHFVDMDPQRRLRVGFVVSDVANAMIGRSLLSWLGARDRAAFEATCYATGDWPASDPIALSLRGSADAWRDVQLLSDEALAGAIRNDRIDILVDLAGHRAGNRLLTFARKPAPVQATWLGYPHTTGLTAIDYRLTDSVVDPPGHPSGAFNVETMIRLDRSCLCASWRDGELPPIGRIRRRRAALGHVGDIDSGSKDLMQSWGRILCAVPGARLLWMNRELGEPATIARVRGLLRQHGVATDRVELVGDAAPSARLGFLDRVDLLLDSYPMSDPWGICDALMMGVPVLTLAGQHGGGRSGASVLSAAGLVESIANDPADYVSLAIALARRGVRSAEDRRVLRDAVASSPLCNAAAFAKQLDAAYRRMWERFCGV